MNHNYSKILCVFIESLQPILMLMHAGVICIQSYDYHCCINFVWAASFFLPTKSLTLFKRQREEENNPRTQLPV